MQRKRTKCALSVGWTISAIVRKEIPSHTLSRRLHRVTQWMSLVNSTLGRARSSSYASVKGCSTHPVTRNRHLSGSKRGGLEVESTGHLSVSACPGGRRPADRASSSLSRRSFRSTSDGRYVRQRDYCGRVDEKEPTSCRGSLLYSCHNALPARSTPRWVVSGLKLFGSCQPIWYASTPAAGPVLRLNRMK
jgi:hypothetical protein